MASSTTLPGKILTLLTAESYYDTFVEYGYDNIDILSVAKLEDLLEMGVMKIGHAKYVIAQIKSSCESNSSTPAVTCETKSNSDQVRVPPSVGREWRSRIKNMFRRRKKSRLEEERISREKIDDGCLCSNKKRNAGTDGTSVQCTFRRKISRRKNCS